VFLAIADALTPPEVTAIRDEAADLTFGDGRKTAGRHAAEVKANDQAAPSPALEAIQTKVTTALMANTLFASAARPRQMTPLILSRYRQGQTYGTHVDDALMRGLRTDLSFTLFLSDPDTYAGGALVIEDTLEAREIKLRAGDLILYPSTSLHRVAPVTSGERLAMVGWVQSWIRQAEQREILFDLDRSIAALFDRDGKSEVCDTLTKTRSNLLRLWAET
jgi:PKHD-type hydroxylase